MKEKFNTIIVQTLNEFISSNNLLSEHTTQIKKYTFYKNLKRGNSYNECKKDILNFDIFEPISLFNYGKGKLHLIEFDGLLNNELFNIFLTKFFNTEFEDLFFSSITKIIPINYCIENQSWNIIEKFLNIPQLKSNGLPNIENTKLFFDSLKIHTSEKNFNLSLINFCKNNKSLIKRIESQKYLLNLIKNLENYHDFDDFIYLNENLPLVEIKNDFISYYFNKNILFSEFSHLVNDKYHPIEKMVELISYLNSNKLQKNFIDKIFLHQKESEHTSIIVLVSFNNTINYSFDTYLLFLLENIIKNNIPINKELEKISNFFFLNNNLNIKNIKEKKTKI